MKDYHYSLLFCICLAILAAIGVKFGMWLFEPSKPLGFEYVENNKLQCWRFTDDQGKGPGRWECTVRKDVK